MDMGVDNNSYQRINHFIKILRKFDVPEYGVPVLDWVCQGFIKYTKNKKIVTIHDLNKYLNLNYPHGDDGISLMRGRNMNPFFKKVGGGWILDPSNSILIVFAHSDQSSYFSKLPKELVQIVAEKCKERIPIHPIKRSDSNRQNLKTNFLKFEEFWNSFERRSFLNFRFESFPFKYVCFRLLELEKDVDIYLENFPIVFKKINHTNFDLMWVEACKYLGWEYKGNLFEKNSSIFSKYPHLDKFRNGANLKI